jgi:hypothetical protein
MDKTKVRDKYMITGYHDGYYQVRKFTKSQLRSKTYDVKGSECYPVLPNVLETFPNHAKGRYESDDESDDEAHVSPSSQHPSFLVEPGSGSGVSPNATLHDVQSPNLPEDPGQHFSYSPDVGVSGNDQVLDITPPDDIIQPLDISQTVTDTHSKASDAISQTLPETSLPRCSKRVRRPPERFGDCVSDF